LETYSEKRKAVEVIKAMYSYAGLSITIRENQINDKVIKAVHIIINKILRCSEAMSLVPQPPMGKASLFWLATNAAKIITGMNNGKISKTCVYGIAYHNSSQLQMAINGI
jgi:hypothetical protein